MRRSQLLCIGAGKSTLISLIPRLYDVTAGSVTIDGHDIRNLTLPSLRSAIGVVARTAPISRLNCRQPSLRRSDATDGALCRHARTAQIHDTIDRLPDGYDTVVGDVVID